MDVFSQRVRELRLENKLSVKQLASMLKMSSSTIYNIEMSRVRVRMKTIIKYALYFNISSDYLIGRIDYRKKLK